MKIDRRDFVFSLAALAVAPPAFLMGHTTQKDPSATGDGLSDTEKKLLGDICEQLIPTDEFPGARELNVVEFIDRMLTEAHPDWIVVYRSGLKSTELCSQELHGKRFSELEWDQQTQFLTKMQRGDLPWLLWNGLECGEFFGMVLSHTMHGYYSHPKWGGNRDKLAWKMIGYDDWWV
ncbi:MAG: gluconate 2-dehydrogenase subunit 3 family protein [Acidobacteriota bacterium]|nr:MAG: gluconate 2-dehydrogenase subunit 3 family protein [Acidobacteriota bacterium]